MRIKTVANFIKGLITSVEDYSLPDGASSNSLNWINNGDKIELRKGYRVFGTELSGTGKVTGLHVTFKANGTQILYRKRSRKLEYYNTSTSDWMEVSTNLFPAAASSEDVSFANYASLAGNQMFFGSPNSSVYKVMSANPGDYSDQAPSVKGHIKIKQNRTFLWGRKEDKTGIYGSYIDAAAYTTVTAENLASGNGVQTTFTGTLAFKGAGATRTCFAVQIFESGGAAETFTDDYNGVLTGSAGGTGTINYMTGAFSVTFAAAPANTANNIKATYQWENSANTGVMDFSKSTPRTAGQGFAFRQDDGGGDVKSVESYGDVEYCLHRLKTWALTITSTDTNATNLIFRERVGIPNVRASVSTGDGIYFVDDFDQSNPKFRLLTLNNVSTQVIPIPVSDQLNLTDYRFDKAATIEWGDFVLFACRHEDSTENNAVFSYNKRLKLWEKHDYNVACFAIYNGALVAGDSITENVFELLSGFDDNNSTIANYWESNLSKLDTDDLKKTRRLWVQGEIARNQTLKVYLSFDRGEYTLVGTQNGTDPNVDSTSRGVIGSDVVGSGTLGSQTSSNVYNYIKEIRLRQGRFREVKIKFEATAVGPCSVSSYTHHDVIIYPAKLPLRYRDT
jgi:hypothetical protein